MVIDALGGTKAVSLIPGVDVGMQSVTNWRAAGRLPARVYLPIIAELQKVGCTAPAWLFGMNVAQVTDPPVDEPLSAAE